MVFEERVINSWVKTFNDFLSRLGISVEQFVKNYEGIGVISTGGDDAKNILLTGCNGKSVSLDEYSKKPKIRAEHDKMLTLHNALKETPTSSFLWYTLDAIFDSSNSELCSVDELRGLINSEDSLNLIKSIIDERYAKDKRGGRIETAHPFIMCAIVFINKIFGTIKKFPSDGNSSAYVSNLLFDTPDKLGDILSKGVSVEKEATLSVSTLFSELPAYILKSEAFINGEKGADISQGDINRMERLDSSGRALASIINTAPPLKPVYYELLWLYKWSNIQFTHIKNNIRVLRNKQYIKQKEAEIQEFEEKYHRFNNSMSIEMAQECIEGITSIKAELESKRIALTAKDASEHLELCIELAQKLADGAIDLQKVPMLLASGTNQRDIRKLMILQNIVIQYRDSIVSGKPLSNEPTNKEDKEIYRDLGKVIASAESFLELFKNLETRLLIKAEEDALIHKEESFRNSIYRIDERKARLERDIDGIICRRRAREIINDVKAEINLYKSEINDVTVTKSRIPEIQAMYGKLAIKLENEIKVVNESIIPNLEALIDRINHDYINNSEYPDEADENITRISRDGYEYLIDGKKILFSLLDESYSELFFEENATNDERSFSIYDFSAYHSLVDAAVDVKKQPLFSDYAEKTSYPYFRPFKYQLESVKTMLTRFEGNGIYGDQVGLGKTPQALMTADAMFKCGTIKNAVIVANKKIIRQWRKECERKFRDENGNFLFELYPESVIIKDGEENTGSKVCYSFDELIRQLEIDRQAKNPSALKVYFLSTDSLKDNGSIKMIRDSLKAQSLEREVFRVKYTPLPSDMCALTADLSKEFCIARLKAVATRLIDEFVAAYHNDAMVSALMYKFGDDVYNYKLTGAITEKPEDYEKIIDWNMAEEWKIIEDLEDVGAVRNDGEFFFGGLAKFNDRLEYIRQRCIELENDVNKLTPKNIFAKQRLIDLLIFDEVQELLISFADTKRMNGIDVHSAILDDENEIFTDKALNKAMKNKFIQEFIATIQKKYCILLSATPIKNDLDDIFNLLYMVDKNKLGDTREEAAARFYKGYCGNYNSLQAMAESDDPKSAFQLLNGLINSRFTRKRLYDDDVEDSLRRQCTTQEERDNAKRLGRDEYGGAKFKLLSTAISSIKKSIDTRSAEQRGELISKVISYKSALFRDFYSLDESFDINSVLSDEEYINHLTEINKCIQKSTRVEIERLKLDLNTDFALTKLDICEAFLQSLEKLEKIESLGESESYYDPETRKTLTSSDEKNAKRHEYITKCNLLCSYINRGILDYYMDYHKERTTFLADYIDWRRPAKKGVVIKCIDEKSKFDRICNAFDMDVDEKEIRGFVINEKDRGQLSVSDAIKALRQNKVLFFEKSGKLRHDFYSSIRYAPAKFGSRRKVYVNLPDDGETIRKYGYTVDDLVDLSFFGKGAFKQKCSERYEQILSKDESSRTFEESRFIKTWKKDGSRNFSRGADGEIDASSGSLFAGMNQEWFSELTTENGNWNAVYFMDKTQIAGMNLNAANILVISQLDSYENGLKLQYLDPLDIEQLIGRISRTGQTEECIVYTCLCNGDKPLTDDDQMFNETYYDILSDPNGFDLFGKSQTEIDFVLPVVMACARHMFSKAGSFVQGKIDEAAYNLSTADFKVIYESEEAQNKASKRLEGVETFPQMLKFAIELEKEGKIIVNRGVADARKRTISVSSAIKILIQIYSRLLSHTDADKSSFYIDDEEA